MKNINKYVVTGVLFLGITAYAGISILVKNRVELKNTVFSSASIKEKIENIEETYRNLPNEDELLNIYSMEQSLMQAELYEDAEYGVIIKDTHGKLHFPYKKVDVTPCVEGITKFNEELKRLNIPLLYVQYPAKKLEGYTVFPVSEYDDFSNECADEFLKLISANGIRNLDIRDKIVEENLDRSALFYKTDHHWTTQTALWATKQIVKYLNANFELNLDENKFELDKFNATEYKEFFLGSLGRRVGEHVAGKDDYTFLSPKGETQYEIYFPLHSKTKPLFSGDFMNTIVRKKMLESKDDKTNRYACYFEFEYGNLIIKNKKVENGKKVLLIKDSFSLPVAAFLSTELEELHLIDVRATGEAPESVMKYVENNEFDIVIIAYNTQAFEEKMFDFE